MQKRFAQLLVGLFMLAGVAGLLILAVQVSGLANYSHTGYYTVVAQFDNIGGLKVRAPVRIAGVSVGRVTAINLDKTNFRAQVVMSINDSEDNLPVDSAASILTEGLLGANYISVTPGFETKLLRNGDEIANTHPALILEKLIGQLLFNIKGK